MPGKAAPNYDPALIGERQQVIANIKSMEFLLGKDHGITSDLEGTVSAEQGMSLTETRLGRVVGLHVVDTSLILPSGPLEQRAYERQEGGAERMFTDPVLYRWLNFTVKKGWGRGQAPARSVYFRRTDDGLQPVATRRSLFINQGDDSPDHAHLEEFFRPLVNERSGNIFADGERLLTRLSGEYFQRQLDAADWPTILSSHNTFMWHRPMRVWSDFKSMQFLSLLQDGGLPVYSTSQVERMRRRAAGGRGEADPADIRPNEVGEFVLAALHEPDIKKMKLESDNFLAVLDNLDPTIVGDDPMLCNILRWCGQNDLLEIEPGTDRMVFRFANLDTPMLARSGNMLNPETAYEAIQAYLGKADQSQRMRETQARGALREFHQAAVWRIGMHGPGKRAKKGRRK